jgi:hypothetical protein
MDQNAVLLELLRHALEPKRPDHLGDLIKIGLPILAGLVAGWFTFLNTKTTLKRDAQQRYAERRRGLLENVQKKLVEYDKAYRHQKAAFDSVATMRSRPEEHAKWVERFKTLDEALRLKAEVFAEISGVLLLLGEPAAEKCLEAYRELSSEWYKKSALDASDQDRTALEPLRKSIVEKREIVMAELARIYKHEG